jgi:predicted DNA-binding ribbon-helix-helix protein
MGTKKALPDIIEMSVGLVDMSYESSENIFYGAFLAICELKKCTLKLLQQKILASQIRDINKVIAIRRVIVERYN